MEYRHEWKHEISYLDLLIIRQRLQAIAQPDRHAVEGKYSIRSLYFDTPTDKALWEKLDGVNRREKFRIRYYNGDTSVIHLEKKSKIGNLSTKQITALTVSEAQAIVNGCLNWIIDSDKPLLQEFYSKMQSQQLQPKTIVDYTREPFVYGPGNVRVTLDYDIRVGLNCTDFLKPCVTIPAGDAPMIMEVKWGSFLPAIIRDAVQLESCRSGAFSKYAQCRIYG